MFTVTMRIGNDTCTTSTRVEANDKEAAAHAVQALWSGAGVKVLSVVAS